MIDQQHQTSAERFLYREARLLDEERYEEWLDLWAEDAVCTVPTGDGDRAEETKTMLAMRAVKAAAATGHTTRLIANVELEGTEDEIVAHSVIVIRRVDADGAVETIFGRRTDLLRSTTRSWRIMRREVELDSALPAGPDIFF